MTSLKVPGIATIYESLEVSGTHHTLTGVLYHHVSFLESTFHYLAQERHCLPQTQFNFLHYSVGYALTIFGYSPNVNPPSKNEV